MYKNRYFLIGLGFGFILCGILLIISSGDFISSNSSLEEFTIEELKEIALEKNLYLYTEEEFNGIINNLNKVENDIPNDIDETIGSEVNEIKIKFTIPYGLDSFEIAEYLYNIGVLNDKHMFQKILTDNNLTKKIIAGEYETIDITISELIELITKTDIES